VFLRLFLLLSFFFGNLFSCNAQYNSCIAKVKDSHTLLNNNTISLSIANKKRLIFTFKKPKAHILKYDPFLSLYLIQDKNPFAYPFVFSKQIKNATALVSNKESCMGKFTHRQIGLDHFAKYTQAFSKVALISDACCAVVGIATPKGVIEAGYLRHFIKEKSVFYGDLGIRLGNTKGSACVIAVDPFFEKNPFKVADRLVSIDGRKLHSAADAMQLILFTPLNSRHMIVIQRNKTLMHFEVKTQKRYGGGYLSDTFLESQGAYFSDDLRVIKVEKKFLQAGLLQGDKLIAINKHQVKDQNDIRRYIQKNFKENSFLFERNGFEFFVKIK
jgi:hypothetical protein